MPSQNDIVPFFPKNKDIRFTYKDITSIEIHEGKKGNTLKITDLPFHSFYFFCEILFIIILNIISLIYCIVSGVSFFSVFVFFLGIFFIVRRYRKKYKKKICVLRIDDWKTERYYERINSYISTFELPRVEISLSNGNTIDKLYGDSEVGEISSYNGVFYIEDSRAETALKVALEKAKTEYDQITSLWQEALKQEERNVVQKD